MKKYILYLWAGLLAGACQFQEDSVFDESPTQRRVGQISEYINTLESQSNGWLLDYYVANGQTLGGHQRILKFVDGKVMASSENHFDEVTSYYTLQNADGRAIHTLSFDTYNEVLHEFSAPSPNYPRGRGGDFEFSISYQDGVFTLIGNKTNTIMTLTRFEGDKNTYFNNVLKNRDLTEKNILDPILVNGTEIDWDWEWDTTNRQLVYTLDGETKKVAYTITDKGIKLYESVTIEAKQVQEFYFSTDEEQLATADGSAVFPLTLFPDDINPNKLVWTGYITQGYASANFIELFEQNRVASFDGYVYEYKIQLGNNPSSWKGITLTPKHTGTYTYAFPVGYLFEFAPVPKRENQISITIPSGIASKGQYWNWFTDMLPLIREVAKHSPYLVSEEHGMKKLTSVADDTIFMYMLKQDEPLHPFSTEQWQVQFTADNVSDELVQTWSSVRAARSGYRLQPDIQLGRGRYKYTENGTEYQTDYTGAGFVSRRSSNGELRDFYYDLNFMPVLNADGEKLLGISLRAPRYSWNSFRGYLPLLEKFVENSPYKLGEKNGKEAYISVNNPDVWFCKFQ